MEHMTTTLVETAYGKVQGTQDGDILVWKGIHYAQPPLGTLRFHAPQPLSSWSGVRDATQFSLVAPQPAIDAGGLLGGQQEAMGEDCLYLNIWSPGTNHAKRPVLVWIHGGSFLTGSGSTPWYDGAAFAAHGDVVVVTINYRLGALGFLYLGDLDAEQYASGNYGILDQVAALQWVHENIAAFGGDAQNVTIFGESAGAMSVGTLMGMPAARDLFQKAILQSGASSNVFDRGQATKRAITFLDALGLPREQLAQLAEMPLTQLMAAQEKLFNNTAGLAFSPVIDGVTLPTRPLDAIAHGSAAHVTTLIGTNRDEMRLFTVFDPQQAQPNQALLQHYFGTQAEQVMATYSSHTDAPTAAWNDILTDRTFRLPAIRLAEQQVAQGAGVWMYRFDWPTPVLNGLLGACHALEIPFVWDNLHQKGVKAFTGDASTRQPLADCMHSAWILFAQHGNPHTPVLPEWPAYDSEQRATMIFDETCRIAHDPQGEERRFWDGVIA